jgi:hypothetical protein
MELPVDQTKNLPGSKPDTEVYMPSHFNHFDWT